VGKLTVAALEAVLRLYRDPDQLRARLPTLRLLTRPTADIHAQAERLLGPLRAALPPTLAASALPMLSQIGSGALPVDLLPSAGLAITPQASKRQTGRALEAIEAGFRALPIPVIGRVREQRFQMDLRCLDDEPAFAAQLAALRLGR
jgi:L-seryl-tRNA(Ser) seleniumtransferase